MLAGTFDERTDAIKAVKVIVCHNFYQQPGGEDQVFADETALLESHGHAVVRFTVHNDAVAGTGKLALVGKTIWNRSIAREIGELVRRERADVVHFHNTFPLISPAAYYAARKAGAAVVQTLHNYRLLCPGAMFLRDGNLCETCLGRAPVAAVVHKCYRGSRAASAATAAMLMSHRAVATYGTRVDAYVALTEFGREKFIAGGLPAARVVVKPNFVSPDPGAGDGRGGYAVFVGRLAPGKGLETLVEAWTRHSPGMPLKVLGDGPLADVVRGAAGSGVEWLGRRPLAEVYDAIGSAALLVMPSVWFEGLPKTLIESFAKGTPVVATRLGALAECVAPGRTGLHFERGDAADLARQVKCLAGDEAARTAMRAECRREYEARYTAEHNYRMLTEIYRGALERRHGAASVPRESASRPAVA
jgi:glycosyltransferase involved in cell wall biosynthesis